jgi:RNA polymerase sigma-70 factor (ECF subfamily)
LTPVVALEDLLARIGDADASAFRSLFETVAPLVKGMARRLGADAITADEIVQDTFMNIWRKATFFSPQRGAALPWIFAIARNARIDRMRRQATWQELGRSRDHEPAEEPLPDEALQRSQMKTRLEAALASLPPEQAAVVRMAFFEGLTQRDIATTLAIPLGTVKTRMTIAYRKIKAAIQEER